ncbi:class I adenylate-forming enzyme family protein [Candidatus Halobeggiatoa sp. HSG11]|nr:class I adenylate-forming enzyme family protein [Candidatus Halobeggiatoa sp. HSG11]
MSTIAHKIFNQANNNPAKIAIYCDENSINYRQLADMVSGWSVSMQEQGVKYGDHIAVLLPNCIEYIALMLVAANNGLVLVPLNIALPIEAIYQAFITANVKHVVATANILKLLDSKIPIADDSLWISLDEKYNNAILLIDLIGEAQTNFKSEGQDNAPFILTMTSGSTGNPKPITLEQQTKLARANSAIEIYKISNIDITLVATPLYHSLAERLVLIALLTGGTAVLMPRFSPSEWIRIVEEKQVSFTIAVSSQLSQIANHIDKVKSIDSLRCVVSSSALLELKIKERLITKLNCEFHECYGTSEIAIATNLTAKDATFKLKSVGKAISNVEIGILTDNGTIAGVNEVGEIICKTPMLFSGYYGQPKLTNDAIFDDYFCTGDIGRIDEDGFLYFLGRKKEIIISGGINIYPADIESVIIEYDLVQENAVFPFPDDKLGEIVAVAIVPKEQFNLRTLRLLCAERLADYQQPRKFFIVEKLPKNSLGKIMKHQLISTYT